MSSEVPRIDCHVHLQDPALAWRIDEVLAETRAAGVGWLVCNGTRPADWAAVLSLARKHPEVIPCFGLHPWYLSDAKSDWMERLDECLRAVPSGVGEIGLDRWIKRVDEDAQQYYFITQLDLARRLHRPVMLHCLQAWDWMLEILRGQTSLPPGILVHGFGGPENYVAPLVELGAYFTFSGTVLDEQRRRARMALAAVPADRLLVETDAPDMLPPRGFRPRVLSDSEGKYRNHPANLPAILRGVAELRGVGEDELAETVWENARRFFGSLLDRPTEDDL